MILNFDQNVIEELQRKKKEIHDEYNLFLLKY